MLPGGDQAGGDARDRAIESEQAIQQFLLAYRKMKSNPSPEEIQNFARLTTTLTALGQAPAELMAAEEERLLREQQQVRVNKNEIDDDDEEDDDDPPEVKSENVESDDEEEIERFDRYFRQHEQREPGLVAEARPFGALEIPIDENVDRDILERLPRGTLGSMDEESLNRTVDVLHEHLQYEQPRVYNRVRQLIRDTRSLVKYVVFSCAAACRRPQHRARMRCFFVDAPPQSGKTSIKAFIAAVAYEIGTLRSLGCKPYTVLLAQFLSLVRNVAATFKNLIVGDNYRAIMSSGVRGMEEMRSCARNGGTICSTKGRASTFDTLLDFISNVEIMRDNPREPYRPCILLVDEADVLPAADGITKFNRFFLRLQERCASMFLVSATIFATYWDMIMRRSFEFGGLIRAAAPPEYVGHEALVPWDGRNAPERRRGENFPEIFREFYRDALSLPRAVIMSATTPAVLAGHTTTHHVLDVAREIPDLDFIGIIISGGEKPFRGQIGILISGTNAERNLEALLERAGLSHRDLVRPTGLHVAIGENWRFVDGASLLPWLREVERRWKKLYDNFPVAIGDDVNAKPGLKALCLLLGALRQEVPELESLPIIVAGNSMLRRSLSVVGYSNRPLAAITHIISIPAPQQPANETLQHFTRAAGVRAVSRFRSDLGLNNVPVLTTERAWETLELQRRLATWGIVPGANGVDDDQTARMLRELFERMRESNANTPEEMKDVLSQFMNDRPEWKLPGGYDNPEATNRWLINPFSVQLNRPGYGLAAHMVNEDASDLAKRTVALRKLLWRGVQLAMYFRQLLQPEKPWFKAGEVIEVYDRVKDIVRAPSFPAMPRLETLLREQLREYLDKVDEEVELEQSLEIPDCPSRDKLEARKKLNTEKFQKYREFREVLKQITRDVKNKRFQDTGNFNPRWGLTKWGNDEKKWVLTDSVIEELESELWINEDDLKLPYELIVSRIRRYLADNSGREMLDVDLTDFDSEIGVVDVEGDGNCLFRAVSHQLESVQEGHANLRQIAVDYLRNHPELLAAGEYNDEKSREDYLRRLSQNGSWGDQYVLEALSRALGYTIVVVSDVDGREEAPVVHNPEAPERCQIMLGFVNGNHYVSIQARERVEDQTAAVTTQAAKRRRIR